VISLVFQPDKTLGPEKSSLPYSAEVVFETGGSVFSEFDRFIEQKRKVAEEKVRGVPVLGYGCSR
jgi:hypothetical protein